DKIFTRLVLPPVVSDEAITFGPVALSTTASAEFEIAKLLIVGCDAPTARVAPLKPTGLLESVKAPAFPVRLSVAPLMIEMEELFAMAPAPLSASTPLLTTVLPV